MASPLNHWRLLENLKNPLDKIKMMCYNSHSSKEQYKINEILGISVMVSTTDFDSVNGGSNPSSPAIYPLSLIGKTADSDSAFGGSSPSVGTIYRGCSVMVSTRVLGTCRGVRVPHLLPQKNNSKYPLTSEMFCDTIQTLQRNNTKLMI